MHLSAAAGYACLDACPLLRPGLPFDRSQQVCTSLPRLTSYRFCTCRRKQQAEYEGLDISFCNPLEAGQGLPDAPTYDVVITMDAVRQEDT